MVNELAQTAPAAQDQSKAMKFSPLDFNKSPEITPEALMKWGKTLAIAPHPDDESIGCGGTLALLSRLGVETAVMWVSDGSASHPNSKIYTPSKLTNLREAEGKMALDKLGVGRRQSYFLRLPDGNVPFPGDPRFPAALKAARNVLEVFQPQTLLLPWRRDPNRDHRASWQLLTHASNDLDIQRFEYLWSVDRAAEQDWPQNTEASGFVIDIAKVKKRKVAAIYAHASQTTRVIRDDPDGFFLSRSAIAHFERPYEAWIVPFCSIPEASGRSKERDKVPGT